MENRAALWAVAGPLIVLKIWATALLLIYEPTRNAVAIVVATHWTWSVPIAVLVVGPAVAWSRLVRGRARRERLRRSEWMMDDRTETVSRGDRSRVDQWPLWETVSRVESGERDS